ncbi:hypothetical protein BBO99_00009741, partial [Phytophthora kernoviae]
MRLGAFAFTALAFAVSAYASVVEFNDLSARYKAGIVFAPNDGVDGSSTDAPQGATFTKSGLSNGDVSQMTIYKTGTSHGASGSSGSSSEVTQQSFPTQVDNNSNTSQNNVGKPSSGSDVSQGSAGQSNASNNNTEAPPVYKGDCVLTRDYINGTNVRKCDSIIIDSLHVPAGVTLNLTKLADGATVSFQGTTTFGPMLWDGPLVKLQGNNLTVTGPGTLDGQGAWYWPYGQNVTRPVFFKLNRVNNSTLSGFNLLNMLYRTFSIGNSSYT